MSIGFRNGDADDNVVLFDALIEQHHGALFSFLFGRCGDRDLAADLLQEVYVRVWLNIGEAKGIPVERRRYWLVAIARHVLVDGMRRRAARAPVACSLPACEPADSSPSPGRVAEGKDALASVDAAIRALPEDLRTVLILSVTDGMSSVEIATMLGVPAGTVRYQISEARNRIARKVGL
jgi:RNA polymerase sigma-70 factor, ECF subfamily